MEKLTLQQITVWCLENGIGEVLFYKNYVCPTTYFWELNRVVKWRNVPVCHPLGFELAEACVADFIVKMNKYIEEY